MTATNAAPYPVVLSVADDQLLAQWRPLVHWLLAIPHLIVTSILHIVSILLTVISWFVVVVTGKLPSGFAGFQTMLLRYSYRAYGYFWGLSEQYPPFTFDDRGGLDDIRVEISPELEHRNRLTVIVRPLLLIPLAIVAVVYALGMMFVGAIAWFAVLFTGTYPLGLRMLMVGLFQWALRAQAYGALLTDRYPPFGATTTTL